MQTKYTLALLTRMVWQKKSEGVLTPQAENNHVYKQLTEVLNTPMCREKVHASFAKAVFCTH